MKTVNQTKLDVLQQALLSAKANMLDHQGCMMPLGLMDAVIREIDAAIAFSESASALASSASRSVKILAGR